MATPSMTPGVEHTPLMTWGQLEGTPMRLDPSDGPPLAQGSEGPQFHIARTPAREDLGRKISQRATTSLHTNLRGQGGGRSPGDWQSPGGFTPQPGTGRAPASPWLHSVAAGWLPQPCFMFSLTCCAHEPSIG